MRRFFLLGLMACFSVSVGAAEPLQQARRLFDDLEYKQALEISQQVLSTAIDEPERLLEAMEIAAMCLGILEEEKKAEALFLQILALKPDFRLPDDVTPKVGIPFRAALKKSAGVGQVRLEHRPPAEVSRLAGLGLEVNLPANPLGLVSRIRLRYRAGGKEVIMEKEVEGPGSFLFTVGPEAAGKELKYSFQALGSSGGVLKKWPAEMKEAALAISAPAPGPPKQEVVAALEDIQDMRKEEDRSEAAAMPWWKTWWFWTIVGVAVAGTTTGVVLGTRGGATGYRYSIEFE